MFVTTFTLACNSVYYVTSFLYGFIWILHIVLPFVIDIGIFGVVVYHWTRLRKPDNNNVIHIFGPEPGSKDSELHPQKTVRCIAHRGAGLDAPENTLQAFKYCVENECSFVELDVRLSRDGQLVLLHDEGLERLSGTDVANIRTVDWETIKNIDVGATHPNRLQFKEVRLCLLDDAINYLLFKEVRMIIDVKGESQQMVNEILTVFASRPVLYKYAVVTSFNPFILYQIRRRDPNIVGAISYRPYCFSAQNYDAENGPTNPRFGDRLPLQMLARGADVAHAVLWRWSARWCAASAVLVHKDIVSPYLISGCSFRTMSSSFRLGESTIRSILKDVCNAIINTMKGKFMPTPTTEDWKRIADGFNKKWNFPNCIGAIDGKHVNIIAPASSGSLFFNYKKHFSIVLMAVVDDKYRFIAVDIGAYGKNSDGGILASSRLGRAIEMNTFNIPTDTPLPGTEIIMPHVFVADEAFPLKRNLLRPYPRSSGISEKERIYNNRLSRARRVVENAFGILYQKFGIYNKNLHLHPKYVDIVVFATCILHNVMRCYNITSDDEVNTRQSSANNDDEQRLLSNLSTIPEDISESSASAFETRDMFATYFQSPEGRVPWQHLI